MRGRDAIADHYKMLGVSSTASMAEVKKAFRRRAKECHPDRNRHRTQWATAEMKRLIEAHRVLSNASLREMYDRKHRHAVAAARERTEDKAFVRHRPHATPAAAEADRILDCLLNGKEAEAFENYERLIASPEGFELSDYLDVRDWVDAKFLLAECYQRRGKHEQALALYEALYRNPEAHTRYKEFRQEVRDRILTICCRDLAAKLDPPQAAQVLLRALDLDLPKARKAFLYKKLAECCLAVGDDASARRHLATALTLKPDIKGAAKICARLQMDPGAPPPPG